MRQNNDARSLAALAVWENPERLFGVEFKTESNGRYKASTRHGNAPFHNDKDGKIRLELSDDQENIWIHYNGKSLKTNWGLFDFVAEVILNDPGNKKAAISKIADVYGFKVQFSKEDMRKITSTALAREIAPILCRHLREDKGGEVWKYLEGRGFDPAMKFDANNYAFGELTPQSLKDAEDALTAKGIKWDEWDFRFLHVSQEQINKGMTCVLPHYREGLCDGFVLRNILPNIPKEDRYDRTGKLAHGYCARIDDKTDCITLVEGQFDALRLMQAGARNVVAFESPTLDEGTEEILRKHEIDQVTYVPDLEFDEHGKRDVRLVSNAIKGLQKRTTKDGERLLKYINIADLPTPQGIDLKNYKTDAADYGRDHLRELSDLANKDYIFSWQWEIERIPEAAEEAATDGQISAGWVRHTFDDIYNRASAYDKEKIKEYVDGDTILQSVGITSDALKDNDAIARERDYFNGAAEIGRQLEKAIDARNPQKIAECAQRLQDASAFSTWDEWKRQEASTWEQDMEELREQPDTLKTAWDIGKVYNEKFISHGVIEFWPADIAVICAATSHGKTTFLIQSAMNLAKQYTDKKFIYVSTEERKPQLLKRAINSYIEIGQTESGRDEKGNFCFTKNFRRKAINAILTEQEGRTDNRPENYYTPEQYEYLKGQVNGFANSYRNTIGDRLRFIHTDGTAESICGNIRRSAAEMERNGEELGGVFIDYMQMLTTEDKSYSRHDELKSICIELKRCALETNVPFIIAAQLNREVYANGIDSVSVANIGEGADIERIAHDVFLLWQTNKKPAEPKGADRLRYNRITKDMGAGNGREPIEGYFYIEALKARDGETGIWTLIPFDGESGRLSRTNTNDMINAERGTLQTLQGAELEQSKRSEEANKLDAATFKSTKKGNKNGRR